ncbi:unnamed protein product, partial [Prorocentrum cordatum]
MGRQGKKGKGVQPSQEPDSCEDDGVGAWRGGAGAAQAAPAVGPPPKKTKTGDAAVEKPAAKPPKKFKSADCPTCKKPATERQFHASAKLVDGKIVTDQGCLSCEEVFICAGLADEYDVDNFAEFTQLCLSNKAAQSAFVGCLKMYDRMSHNTAAGIQLGEVGLATSAGYRVIAYKRGLTPAQFLSIYSKHPGEIGLRVNDLMAPNGKRYKGILKDDEGETLGYKYEFYTDSHAFKSDLLCPRERVLHAGQVSTSWKKSQNAELKKGMLQLLKCCTLTDQKIRESLDAYAQGTPPPTSLENLVGQDDHSNEADEVMESDVEDAEDLD